MRNLILKFIDELKYEKNYSELTVNGYLTDLDMFLEYLNENNIKSYKSLDYQKIRDYISFLYEGNPMRNYDVYFFDSGTMTLFYFHNNS